MSRTALALVILLLTSCSGRPETRAYFTKVTGLPLCKDATVHNVNAPPPDRSPSTDSVYVVEVTMPDSEVCYGPFLGALESRIEAPCAPTMGCSGHSSSGEFYKVHMIR